MRKEEDQTRSSPPQFRKIPRVPSTLRERNVEIYDPLVVSIGPYHHGKEKLERVESLKVCLALQFVRRCNAPIEALFHKVADMVSYARGCYEEYYTERFSKMKFAQMMFLDGCFVLEFIFGFMRGSENSVMGIDVAFLARRELFLLENQLPFEVLNSLMSSELEKGEGMKLIDSFVKVYLSRPAKQRSCKEMILRLSPFCYFPRAWMRKGKKQEIEDHQSFLHLLEIHHIQLIDKNAVYRPYWDRKARFISPIYMHRSVQELRAVGIHFRPISTDRLTDVMFMSSILHPTLKLHPILVDDTTKPMLLNLAAFEKSTNTPQLEVTSYIVFIASLTGHAEDVEELKSKKVLINRLGNDGEVAKLFGSMVTAGVTPNRFIYSDVRSKIEDYSGNWWKFIAVWADEAYRLYFRSPWSARAV